MKKNKIVKFFWNEIIPLSVAAIVCFATDFKVIKIMTYILVALITIVVIKFILGITKN